ncbi:MAG: protein BatD [Desulfobacterales bacterium]|nr:protein BatD [Desulfobacterales bacterium]
MMYIKNSLGYTHLMLCIMLWAVLGAIDAHALDVKATVDSNQIQLDESLRLTITTDQENAEIDLSPITDFKVTSQGTSSQIQIINGQYSKTIQYTYVLFPTKEGQLQIPGLTVTGGGQTAYTQEITVQVSRAPVQTNANRDIFVQAIISENEPFVGQTFLYSFRLYQAIRVSRANMEKLPDFSGFTSKQIEGNRTFRQVISGREYEVTELSVVLIGHQAGDMTIDSAILRCDVPVMRQRRPSAFNPFFDDNFFGFSQVEQKVFRTEPITVHVKPLPTYTGTIPFSGLVGTFSLDASLDQSSIAVGESATLSMTISGVGNIQDVAEPNVVIPNAIKLYKDKPEEEVQVNRSGFTGKKVYRMALVPMEAGDHIVPPFELCYFNVKNQSYDTLKSQEFHLTAQGTSQKDEPVKVYESAETKAPKSDVKNKVDFITKDILTVKSDLNVITSQQGLSLVIFLVLFCLPACFYLVTESAMVIWEKKDDPIKVLRKKAKFECSQAGKTNISDDVFLACLHKSLISAIYANAGFSGESLTQNEIQSILRSKGYKDTIVNEASRLFNQVESARYSGFTLNSDLRKTLLSDIQQVLKEILK